MSECPELRTDRLVLRCWAPEDRATFAVMNADPLVTEFLGGPLPSDRSDRLVDWIEAQFREHGFGFWALEAPGVAPFVGIAGLGVPRFDAPFMPAVEVGWRLGHAYWGCGYASEAARAALDYAFDALSLPEVVAFTAKDNLRSRRVMERLGMTRDLDGDFDHPLVPPGSPVRGHVLYRLRASER